ncbi:hypothetical protein LOZ65_000281 [Ophidiomyces ophidiicola]|nr:hypothetical protein LOZ65_000281 [Ophidiomyces ophidiicola]
MDDRPYADVENDQPQMPTLDGFITLPTALKREEDMRLELQYVEQTGQFFKDLYAQRQTIQEVVASHCGLSPTKVHVPEMSTPAGLVWQPGSFNVSIPLEIDNTETSLPPKLGLRVCLPYKVGEEFSPNNVDEKVRSEAATYIWINNNCPDIPIPILRGFSLPCGISFFKSRYVPLWPRTKTYIQRFFSLLFGRKKFTGFMPLQRTAPLPYGYTLVDWVASDDVDLFPVALLISHKEAQFKNLYRSLSKIMLSLAKLPQSRIGSWTMDDDGCIQLSNRPTLRYLFELENMYIPSGISRNTTYTNADSFHLDMLTGHDNRLHGQDNAAFTEINARAQARDLVLMRALLHRFTDSKLRDGPFLMQMTNLRPTNIFLDKDWNVKYIIGLEGICSLPLEHLQPPQWLLTWKVAPDAVSDDECFEQFKKRSESFLEIFEEEEVRSTLRQTHFFRVSTMKKTLQNGGFWYWHALQHSLALFNIFRQHILPIYDTVARDALCDAISPFWMSSMSSFLNRKMERYAGYRKDVREIFNNQGMY